MQEARKLPNREYIKISTTIIIKMKRALPFDIYIQRAPGKFTKIIEVGNSVDKEQLYKYQSEKNVMFLYIHHDQADAYYYQVEELMENALSPDSEHTKKEVRSILNEMTNIALDEIYEKTEISEKVLRWAEKAAVGCTQVLENDFSGLLKIVKLYASRPHHMKHAFMVSVFSLLLAKALEYESERTLKNIGLGGLVHDIGMTRLPPELATKIDLSPEEWKEKKQHPELGIMILDSISGVPSEVRQIVLQHHEQPNGMGYPNGLFDREIFQMAKIIAVADGFTKLITSNPHKTTEFEPLKALKMMEDEIGKYDKRLLKAFRKVVLPGKSSTVESDPRFNN